MNQRRWMCSLLSLLRIHNRDCERCNAHGTQWDEIQKRLEELSGQTQPCSLKHEDHAEVVEVLDSKLAKLQQAHIFLGEGEAEEGSFRPAEPAASDPHSLVNS